MNNKKITLIFFTGSFPYSVAVEDSFILPELNALCNGFDRVIIVPLSNAGLYNNIEEYSKITVDTSFASQYKTRFDYKEIIRALFQPLFMKTLIMEKTLFKTSKIKYLLSQILHSNRVKDWLTNFFSKNNECSNCVLYTYWFDYATMGCSYFAEKNNVIEIVTRAHGYDVFDYRDPNRSTYMRGRVLSKINDVYAVSKMGSSYLQKKYPKYSHKIHHSYLGINKCVMDYISKSDDKELNLFSCSFMVPVKRVSLLATYIVELAAAYPKTKIIWTHAGGGDLFNQMNDYAKSVNLENLQIILLGSITHTEVLEHYLQKPVDIFLSLSESEGIPVSMMEAQCFGVPIIATNVGGVGEIVIDGETGFLLNNNPSQTEFIEKIGILLNDKILFLKMKKNSFENWQENFDAEKNHKKFVSEIIKC
jgi:glycosyltransferase involved in cell wall biosynthesis